MAERTILGLIERNATEEVQIAINEYKGKKYVDMRVYYTTDEGDSWNPTKKGITIPPEKIEEAIEALEKAKEELCVEEEAVAE